MPGWLTKPPWLPELKSTLARRGEEKRGEALHLPGLFIRKGLRGKSGLSLSLFPKSHFLLLGRIWAGKQSLVQLTKNKGPFSYIWVCGYEGHPCYIACLLWRSEGGHPCYVIWIHGHVWNTRTWAIRGGGMRDACLNQNIKVVGSFPYIVR